MMRGLRHYHRLKVGTEHNWGVSVKSGEYGDRTYRIYRVSRDGYGDGQNRKKTFYWGWIENADGEKKVIGIFHCFERLYDRIVSVARGDIVM